ncbi:MAG: protein translocase subunit SecD [Caldilineales bacterium]|nr:protein translocase subunit SecD [Caldilineales bacterium]
MNSRNLASLILLLLLAAFAIYVALPIDHPDWFTNLVARHQSPERALQTRLGLDLQGGTQVQLEANVPEGRTVSAEDIETARIIIERRVNGLGVAEPLVQTSGERIIVALPGVEDPDAAVETLRSTGQLEFVDIGNNQFLAAGDPILTSLRAGDIVTDAVVYETILTGDLLSRADVSRDPTTQEIFIAFEWKPDGADIFEQFTSTHIGQRLAIVMDATILSAPVINSTIRESGIIEGQFTLEEARNLAIQMQYGALPVPLQIVDVRTVGPSLGEDSVQSSVKAGIIGVIIVLLFMLVYYRLPGFLADLALMTYAALNLMIYKLVPVVLTLPGIAGFLLSTGMAVDANILIFERMKEELRAGRSLGNAIEAGFSRAWTSILDSNLSTLITCLILYYFGSNFGASIVQGFAITLGIGVLISMFTAVIATRTFMRFVVGLFGERLQKRLALFGI